MFFASIAILSDTAFFASPYSISDALRSPIITPINNLIYNSNPANLALHGLHSRYQHFLVNLPQLLGPAFVAMVLSLFKSPLAIPSWLRNMRFVSAISATFILSIFPHQEARFLVPTVPLLLSCIRLPRSRVVLASWVIFNAAMGLLMGVYHQGGVVPTQIAIPTIVSENAVKLPTNISTDSAGLSAKVFWWKTYSPPTWLLGDTGPSLEIETVNLMGMPGLNMIAELDKAAAPCPRLVDNSSDSVTAEKPLENSLFLVAPLSASFLDQYVVSRSSPDSPSDDLQLHELWSYKNHLNLDDLDFETDGIFPTLTRVFGRRGLGVWTVKRVGCN